MLYGCGTTTILVNNSDVDLYVNNVYKGKGHVEVCRTGFPKRLYIEAKYKGASVGELIVKRKLDGTSCLAGYFTYGVGLLFTFRYPASIVVPTSLDIKIQNIHQESIWKRPPNNWK